MKKNLFVALSLAVFGFACQDVEPPAQVLTQEQWNDVKAHLLTEEPTPQYKSGAVFDNRIELIGVDVSSPLEAGKPATFTWYWRALADGTDNWKAFIHFDSVGKPFRQNLDHVPVKDLFATSRWKKGQIIKDVQTVTVRQDFPGGDAVIYLGFYKGNNRMKITNDVARTQEAQPRVIGPTLKMKGSAGEEVAKPSYQLLKVSKEEAGELKIDGMLDEPIWAIVPAINLRPLGNVPHLSSTVKVFLTDTHLHVGAHLMDTHIWGKLTERDSDTWTEEVLEMFLDFDGDGKDYLELQITPNNVVFDAHFAEQLGRGQGSRQEQIDRARAFNLKSLQSAVHVDGTLNDDQPDKSWTVEFRIALEDIPGFKQASIGDSWAANFYRFDRPEPGKTHAYAWSTAPRGDFHQVDKFGTLKIVDRVVVPEGLVVERPKSLNLAPQTEAVAPPRPPEFKGKAIEVPEGQ